ncbi:MAG: XrtA/PEP-CTERM system TPR-repeat protein PrsT [Pseudomonadota bacterium]
MPRNAHTLTITAAVVSGAFLLSAGLSGCGKTETAATLVQEAKAYQLKGDNKAALIQLKNAVGKSPEDAEIRLTLGALYNETGDALSAEKEFRKALSLGATPARVMPGLAAALQAQGEFKKLIEETEAASAKGDAVLLVARGNAYLAMNDQVRAKASFEAALLAKPDDSAARLGLASLAFGQKDQEGGKRLADEAVAKDPKNPDVWMYKGMLAGREGKAEAAIVAYDQALALKPSHRSAHVEKAYLEIGMGKFDAAKADLEKARKNSPGSVIIIYTQALLDFTQGKNEAALESVQKVLKAMPEHMPSTLLAGAIQLNLGQLQQAELNLKKYLDRYPNVLYARKLLASTQLRSKHPTEAAATLAPALKQPSDDPQLLALAGESYMQVRDFDKAAEFFGKASVLAPKAASLRTSLGLSKLGQGNKEDAVAEMEMATTLDPKSQMAGTALVRTALGLKQYDKALAGALALEKQQPDNALVHNMKGGVFLALNKPAEARASFTKAGTLQPTYFPAVANLAQLDLTEKKPVDADKRLQEFLKVDKKHIGAMTALAELSAAQGKTAEAIGWLEKAASENPDVVEPGMRLIAMYLRHGEKVKALTLGRKLATANPTNPDLLDQLGQAQIANGDPSGALESFDKLVNVAPKSAKAQLRLATAHMLLKNDAAAIEDIKRAVQLEPDNLQAQLAMVDVHLRKGQADQALALARRLQKDHPKSPVGQMIEGDIQMNQKKPELAVRAYEQGYALAKSPQLLVKLSQAMRLSGKGKEADARVAAFVKEFPGEPLSSMYLAETQLANKQMKPAIANFELVLKKAPGNVLALNNLAWAYQQEKDPRALPTAEQAAKLAPDSPPVMDTLGWILVEKGDLKRGIAVLEQASARAPDANDIRYHLAYGLHKAGDKAKARKQLEQALANGRPFAQADEARELLKQL